MAAPKVSVIMPVYNAGRYLSDAVESILRQTFTDFEFLIVNDGSTDGSSEILDRYARRDSRIQLWHRPNAGLVPALNFMLGEARTDLIARMDADDITIPDRFDRQVAAFRADPSLVLLGGMVELMDYASRRIGVISQPTSHSDIEDAHLRGRTSICHPASMYRRVAAQRAGGYRQEFLHAEDLDLWLRLGEIGTVRNLEEVILQYRIHDKSVSHMHAQSQAAASRLSCESAWERRGLVGAYRCEFNADRAEDSSRSRWARYVWHSRMAAHDGHFATARYYAMRAAQMRPFSKRTVKAVLGAVLKSSSLY